jgi:hypothetical protein
MSMTTAYFADLSNDHEVAHFPEDFADWLMEEGREQDAREFLITCKNWADLTPPDEQTIDALVSIAEEYAPVVKFDEEIRSPSRTYYETVKLLEDLEKVNEPDSDDPMLPPDREAALINQMLADEMPVVPVNMEEHEFEDVDVYVDDGDSIVTLVLKTFEALMEADYTAAARRFIQEANMLIHRGEDAVELFVLIWSYVTVQPEHGSEHARRMMN